MNKAIPKTFFVLELANNHMGSVEHGERLIKEFGKIAKDFPFDFCFKMQYRQLDSFIHPDYQERMDIKYIKRFSETRLPREHTQRLVAAIKENGFMAMCTPFDNASVDVIIEDGFDILKIASCSFTDWPLLEEAAKTDLPIIASTAGAALEDIDNVVAFMQNRKKDFALMNCVGEYPTPPENLHMGQIDFLRKRYPDIRIGYSTHEKPDDLTGISMAVAKGCTIFEKHVAMPTDEYGINEYSASPDQVRKWVETAQHAMTINGISDHRIEPGDAERKALFSLRRGVFADRDIAKGSQIGDGDVFFAIPTQDGHITANDWSKYNQFTANKDIKKGEPVLEDNTDKSFVRTKIYEIVKKSIALLEEGKISFPGEAQLEISHHYGLDKFDETGIVMITVVNRDYCKKLILAFPGQNHPEQYHKKKEETFHVLHGELALTLDDETSICKPGDVVTVEPGVRHAFTTETGVVIEEISSTHFVDDSYYTDESIAKNPNRKTFIKHWLDA